MGIGSSTAVANALGKVVSRMFGRTGTAVLNGVKQLCCFTAGTPMRTDKGLVPMEQIKVGAK